MRSPPAPPDLPDEGGPLLRLLGELRVELLDLRESLGDGGRVLRLLQVLGVHLQLCQTRVPRVQLVPDVLTCGHRLTAVNDFRRWGWGAGLNPRHLLPSVCPLPGSQWSFPVPASFGLTPDQSGSQTTWHPTCGRGHSCPAPPPPD